MGRFRGRAGVVAVLVAAGLGVAMGLVAHKSRSRPDVPVAGAPEVALRPASAMVPVRPATPVPALVFRTLGGDAAPLSAYAGRAVLVNFWATWCTPCVAELPELDRLAASGSIVVLAVSADRGGAATVGPFVAAHGIGHAVVLLDQGSEAAHALQVAGFPTTLLIGADGRLHGTLEGAAAWGSGGAAIDAALR